MSKKEQMNLTPTRLTRLANFVAGEMLEKLVREELEHGEEETRS